MSPIVLGTISCVSAMSSRTTTASAEPGRPDKSEALGVDVASATWARVRCDSLRGGACRYRFPVRAIRRFTVRPVLPESLRPLEELATNLRWSWHPETQDLFESVDADAWESSDHDPVRFLGSVPATRLQALAGTSGSSSGCSWRRPTSRST